MSKIQATINNYFGTSFRRKLLDKFQQDHIQEYRGVVLDIGGRDRGSFKKPKAVVDRWIFADIEAKHHPDIVLDVAHMDVISTESIDVVNCIELFEHVQEIDKGITECYRVLKNGGTIIISIPFLFPIHADPSDYQRWTNHKWDNILHSVGFKSINIKPMGGFFTTLSDMVSMFINELPLILRLSRFILIPILSLLVRLDNTKLVKNNNTLNKFPQGYFIIANK
ncbi:MAG: methyltransferase domain-containing protein [Candidatus Shapirobacteria bacterium]